MKKGKKFVPVLLSFTAVLLLIFLIMQPLSIIQFREHIAILFPEGWVAWEELNLLLVIQVIMLLVVIPVYILTFIFSWKYSAQNPKGKYDPDLVDNVIAEYIWWGVPLVLTLIIAVLTWVKTYELDPYKPLASQKKAVTIQAVALQWKWLFIYPDEKIATLNYIQIPKQVPIHFEITADAPMNSLWIPALGGQIYAMPNMKTELNLIADNEGDFRGSSANMSGEGFAGMHFIVRSSSDEDYQQWVKEAQASSKTLSLEEYNQLAAPSENATPAIYQLKDADLFHQIMMKYAPP